MQTIWNRVAQVRGSCPCPQCISTVNGLVGRRATASATRRTPRYLTSSTLWYSGIFATAATFDAGMKQRRREKWDQAIAEVKQELAQPADALSELNAEEDLVQKDTTTDEALDEYARENVFRYADSRSKAAWPANTGPALEVHNLPLESIYAEEWQTKKAERRRWVAKKLAMVQTSMDILLLDITRQLRLRGMDQAASEAVPPIHASMFLQDEESVQNQVLAKHEFRNIIKQAHPDMTHYTTPESPDEPLPLPVDSNTMCRYSQDDGGDFHRTAGKLNSALQHLFQLHKQGKLSKADLLGKISFNIKTSSAPPNIDSWNTLLLGFSMADEPYLVRRLIAGLHGCRMRLNELTLATILNHYTKFDRPVGFAFWIELIRGQHSGLALARPDIRITDAGRARLIPHPYNPDKIIQLPHATPMVFGAIISGVLKFSGLDAALQICKSMGQEGWGLCMSGLTPLLTDCAARSDWTSGMVVWNQIQALRAQSTRRIGSKVLFERIQIDTFAAMLQLCSKCDEKEVYDEVWTEALKAHRASEERLARCASAANLPTVEDGLLDAMRSSADLHQNLEGDIDLDQLSMRDTLTSDDVLNTPGLAIEHAADVAEIRQRSIRPVAAGLALVGAREICVPIDLFATTAFKPEQSAGVDRINILRLKKQKIRKANQRRKVRREREAAEAGDVLPASLPGPSEEPMEFFPASSPQHQGNISNPTLRSGRSGSAQNFEKPVGRSPLWWRDLEPSDLATNQAGRSNVSSQVNTDVLTSHAPDGEHAHTTREDDAFWTAYTAESEQERPQHQVQVAPLATRQEKPIKTRATWQDLEVSYSEQVEHHAAVSPTHTFTAPSPRNAKAEEPRLRYHGGRIMKGDDGSSESVEEPRVWRFAQFVPHVPNLGEDLKPGQATRQRRTPQSIKDNHNTSPGIKASEKQESANVGDADRGKRRAKEDIISSGFRIHFDLSRPSRMADYYSSPSYLRAIQGRNMATRLDHRRRYEALKRQRKESDVASEAQLRGSMPSSPELNEYEMGERPMAAGEYKILL